MKKAIPALFLGLFSLVTSILGFGYIFGIPALILGILAAKEKGAPRIIGIIAILFGSIAIVVSTFVLIAVKTVESVVEKATEPHNIYGTAGTEVAVKNWGITVTPPTYTETLYEKSYENEYYTYKSRKGYRFALVKIKAINRGKEEDEPGLRNIKLVTTEGLRYKKKSLLNYSSTEFEKPPTPLVKDFETYESVLPREKTEGYFYFQIPVNAVPESLIFTYGFMGKEVRIKLRS